MEEENCNTNKSLMPTVEIRTVATYYKFFLAVSCIYFYILTNFSSTFSLLFHRGCVDCQDKIMTEVDRSECHAEILDLELGAETNETLGLPFWRGDRIFICLLFIALLGLQKGHRPPRVPVVTIFLSSCDLSFLISFNCFRTTN